MIFTFLLIVYPFWQIIYIYTFSSLLQEMEPFYIFWFWHVTTRFQDTIPLNTSIIQIYKLNTSIRLISLPNYFEKELAVSLFVRMSFNHTKTTWPIPMKDFTKLAITPKGVKYAFLRFVIFHRFNVPALLVTSLQCRTKIPFKITPFSVDCQGCFLWGTPFK